MNPLQRQRLERVNLRPGRPAGPAIGRGLICCLVLMALPAVAHAQYKNASFGVDAGYMLTEPTGSITGGGLLIGGEANIKLAQDHWWVSGRLNAAFLDSAPGTRVVTGEVLTGIRYYILTDDIRPFAQASVSYLRLLEAGLSPADVFAVHLAPGIEYVLVRDVAIHGLVDLQRWFTVGTSTVTPITFLAGMTFFI